MQYVAGVSDESIDSEALLAEADAKEEAERAMKKLEESEKNKIMMPLLVVLAVLVLVLSFVIGVFVFDKEGVLLRNVNQLTNMLMSEIRMVGKSSREMLGTIIAAAGGDKPPAAVEFAAGGQTGPNEL